MILFSILLILFLFVESKKFVRFQKRGDAPPNDRFTLKGTALTTLEDEKLSVHTYMIENGHETVLAGEHVYIYSTTKNYTRAFCEEGTVLKSDNEGFADCTVRLGFVVGKSKLFASYDQMGKNGEIKESQYKYENDYIVIEIGPKFYLWTFLELAVVFLLILLALCFSIVLVVYVCMKPKGTERMQEIAKYISDGASGFLRVQYIAVGIISLPVALLLFFIFLLRPKSHSDPDIPQAVYGVIVGVSFLFGVFCSAISGCIGMFISVRTNIRVAAAALRSYRETMNIAIRGGAFASFCFVALSCFGVASMFTMFFVFFPQDVMNPVQICTVIIGFSFGASFSALFAQLGGGIYTKAADVGADIVGKLESNLPEDDMRNPAVVADLVGDNVGDCAGRGADLFESISANCFGTMILGSSLALNAVPQLSGVYEFVLFPLLILSFGMVSSFFGLFCIRVAEYKIDDAHANAQGEGFQKLDDEAEHDEHEEIDMLDHEHDHHDGIGMEALDLETGIDSVQLPDVDDLPEHDLSQEYEGGESIEHMEMESEEHPTTDHSHSDDVTPAEIEVPDVGISGSLNMSNVHAEEEEEDEIIVHESNNEEEGMGEGVKEKKKFSGFHNPIISIGIGFTVCFFCNIAFYFVLCFWCFFDYYYPNAWWCYALCGVVGITISFSFVFITVYYTDYDWRPTRSIAKASETGAATNIITGCAVGFESACPSALVVCVGILFCFYIGELGGIKNIRGEYIGGFYGISCGTMGMLSTATFILALDTFGPIADNAGGIVEMAGMSAAVREITDRLDAVGNTTKALTKGYAVGTAALAGCLLFFAFLDTVSQYAEVIIDDINISRPEVFVGGLLGAATVYIFVSITLRAVGSTAAKIVKEVRSQFKKEPKILEGMVPPNYKRCVSYCTINALISMILPGLIGTFTPVLVGFFFRFLGWIVGDKFMGVTVTTGYLIVATITSVLLGMFLNNSGGAWDNAKKYVETGKHGGKNSVAHEASIVGDTVGDCAGPSLHVLIKLLATVALVIGPLWIDSSVINSV